METYLILLFEIHTPQGKINNIHFASSVRPKVESQKINWTVLQII